MLNAERAAPDATITPFGNALRWAVVIIAAVGHGDYVPVAPLGRVIATGLMIGGIALVGHCHRGPGLLAGREGNSGGAARRASDCGGT